ncbi:MAG TPA: hypothetical protein VH309_13840, partial [Elusimicrobiota bacterium]|nr:hypothetical protein [Elusimicrobiota bacterium]
MSAAWAELRRAGERFLLIDGAQWAGSLAYAAFTALFPTILLFITAASFWIDRERAGRTVIGLVENYAPMSRQVEALVTGTIARMVESR